MNKFNDIHQNKSLNENTVSKKDYISGLKDLQSAANDENHPLVTSRTLNKYFSNAIKMGNSNGFFDSKLRKKINESFNSRSSDNKIISDNIDIILKTLNENTSVASLGSVNGMGEISLPGIDGEIGSGDILGKTGDDKVFKQTSAKTITMKKFENIKETRKIQESEIYIPILDFADPATLISILTTELAKRNTAKESDISKALSEIEISYNGTVDIYTLEKLSKILKDDTKSIKNKLDKLIDKNINLLESMQAELLITILNNPESLNEGIIGRAIGGITGLALGPKVGKLIAKVLGIQKGPLYNVLTSRVVSAALAQELTKNLI